VKPTEFFGIGSVRNLEKIFSEESTKNIFLVTGGDSYTTCGAQKKIKEILNSVGCNFYRFSDFSPNPKLVEIEKGLEFFEKENDDLIVSVGGGSTIDVAKAIKLFYFKKTKIKIPLIAIPTTAGSGSEATHFIVYYIGKEKQSQGDPEITLPDYTILDPQFTRNLPREITAVTGMDALSQAIESYWCINSIDESKIYAEEAIKLVIKNLERCVNSPSDESREKMLRASNLAGKAINLTKTTACHSIAYPITSYFGIPHGHAVALTLPEMLLYNSDCTKKDCNDKRGAEYVGEIIKKIANLLGEENVEETAKKIKNLMGLIGLKTKLSELGIDKDRAEIIIKNGFKPERVKNNPRLLTEEGLRKILKKIE
jgi:alcohol dehydrogenase